MVKKKLIKIGTSHGFIVDRTFLQLIDATEKTTFALTIQNGALTFTPIVSRNISKRDSPKKRQ